MPSDDEKAQEERELQGYSSEIVPVAGQQEHLPELLRTTEPFYNKTLESSTVVPYTLNGVTTYTERRIERIDLSHVKIQEKVYWQDEDSSPVALNDSKRQAERLDHLAHINRARRARNLPVIRHFGKDTTPEEVQLGVELFDQGSQDIDHLNNPNLGD